MPQRGFDFRRRRSFIAWGAKKPWPPLNPLPGDPNLEVIISSDHTTDPPTSGGDTFTSDFWPLPDVLNIGDPFQPLGQAARNETVSMAANAAWPTANMALLWPIMITESFAVAKMIVHNGDAVAGNFDLGLYTLGGSRLASSGSTAQAGTNVCQAVTVTYTLAVGRYWAALASDTAGGTSHWRRDALGEQERAMFYGMAKATTAFPLPATITPIELAAGDEFMMHVALARSGAFL